MAQIGPVFVVITKWDPMGLTTSAENPEEIVGRSRGEGEHCRAGWTQETTGSSEWAASLPPQSPARPGALLRHLGNGKSLVASCIPTGKCPGRVLR